MTDEHGRSTFSGSRPEAVPADVISVLGNLRDAFRRDAGWSDLSPNVEPRDAHQDRTSNCSGCLASIRLVRDGWAWLGADGGCCTRRCRADFALSMDKPSERERPNAGSCQENDGCRALGSWCANAHAYGDLAADPKQAVRGASPSEDCSHHDRKQHRLRRVAIAAHIGS